MIHSQQDREFHALGLTRFLAAVVPTLYVFAGLELVPAVLYQDLNYALGALFLALIGAALHFCRLQLRRGRFMDALQTTVVTLIVLVAGFAPLQPTSGVVMAIVPLVAIGLVLPHYRGRALASMVIAAWSASLVALAVYLYFPRMPSNVPSTYTAVLQILGFGAAMAFVLYVLIRTREHLIIALQRSREAFKRLQEQDQARTRFLNSVAHELNTPLTPIKVQLHLLLADRRSPLSEDDVRTLNVLQRNVNRLSALVRDAMDVTRLESAQFEVRKEPLDLRALVEGRVADFEESARQAGVTLAWSSSGTVWVDGDPDRLGQVIDNLISNALKFTPTGGRVHLEARAVDGVAEVLVTDTGCGFTEEQREKLFQPFSQVHRESRRALGGTGLGLYIAKGIVENHGGTIWGTSPGQGLGASFGFRLARRGPPKAVIPAPQETSGATPLLQVGNRDRSDVLRA